MKMQQDLDNFKKKNKIFIKTFGCQMNEYDSNRIFDSVKKIGYEKTDFYEEANCYLLNTCHIWDKEEILVKCYKKYLLKHLGVK